MIYIKRQSTSLLLALASLSLTSLHLVSCSESEGLSGVTLSDKKISFTATEVNGWTSNSSSSNDENSRGNGIANNYHPLIVKSDLGKPLYLHPVEQVGTYFYNDKDELVTRAGVPLSEIGNKNSISTRGTKVTEIGDEILVSAVSKKKDVEAGYFPFEEATRSGNTWHISKDEYWTTDASLSFYAYAPTSNSMLSTNNSELSGYRTVHYVAGTGDAIKSQPDFIVAKSENNSRSTTDAVSAVDLHFSHALTAITFAVGKDMVPGKISKITVRGVKGEGDYNIATNTWNTDNVAADAEYTIDNLGPNADGTITGEKDIALTNNAQTLLMIPQSLGSNAEVEIVFDNDNGAKTLTASLNGTSWEVGHSIIYKLSASEVTTLSLGNINFPTNWSSNYATGKLKSAYDGTEKVGLFVVDDQGYIRNANVQLTYNSSTKSWSLPNDVNMLFSPRFKYFAYCNPTSTDLSDNLPQAGTIVTNVTDAASFFSDVINAWTPSSDQSTLSKLNACDLQIGMANISSTASSIDFNMTHAMSLAEVTLITRQDCNCELYSDASYTWTGPVPASENFVGTNKPFKATDYEYTNNKFVEIVKPHTETEFSGGKNEYGIWSLSITAIAPNAIGLGSSVLDKKQRFALELGDIYYSDGALTHQNEALASNKTPIGIVGYIGQNKWTEYNTGSGHGGHALVMGLFNTGPYKSASDPNGTYYRFGPNGSYGTVYQNTSDVIVNSFDKDYGSGFINTDIFIKYGCNCAIQAKNYTTLKAPKDKSTGWFLPTAGQFYSFYSQIEGGISPTTWTMIYGFMNNSEKITAKIDVFLAKVGEGNYKPLFGSGGVSVAFACSSEINANKACIFESDWFVGKPPIGKVGFSSNGYFNGGSDKTIDAYSRPFLAF